MIELNSGQLLQLTLTVECAAMTLVAGVFFLVLRATHRSRGRGWLCGFALFALALGCEAAGRAFIPAATFLNYAISLFSIAGAAVTVKESFDFVQIRRIPNWALGLMTAFAAASIAIAARTHLGPSLLAPEAGLAAGTGITALVLFPLARQSRRPGILTACFTSVLLTLMMLRTLLCAAILGVQHEQLNDLFWVTETIGGTILAFVLAMGELVAILDEVHSDLEESNAALAGALENLEIAARMDPLTGLYNRYAFHAAVAELRRNRTLDGSIVAIDLNGLKHINDTYGHYAGDRALRNVALRLQEMVRSTDYVFRWGGDEFVMLLFDVEPDVARDRLARMRPPDQLQLRDRLPVDLSVSWGVAPLAYDVEAALRQADEHLYSQRRLIRNAAQPVPRT